MKNKKKLLIILITLILIIMTFASCKTTAEEDNVMPNQATSAPTTASSDEATTEPETLTYNGSAPISEEEVTISILTTNGGSLNYDVENMTWQQEKLKLANVKLDMEMIDKPSYLDVLHTRLAAGTDLPDIVFLLGQDSDMSYINAGLFQDLTDLYDKYGFNLNKRFEENPVLKAEMTTPEGRIFYVPLLYLTVDWQPVIMVNKPWLDQVEMDVPETTDELYDMFKAFKDAGDLNGNGTVDEIPLFMRAGYTQRLGTLWGLDLFKGFIADENGVVECSYAAEEYKDFLTYCNRMYEEGLLYSEFPTANYDTQTNLFSNNQIGSILHFNANCTGYSYAIDPEWDSENDEPIMQPIVPPAGPYGDQWYGGRDGLGPFFGISRDCEDPETVFCFMDYMFSDEAAELSWYGIEGVDYEVVDDEYVFSEQYLTDNDYRSNSGYNFEGWPAIQIPGSYGAMQAKAIKEANDVIRNYMRIPIGFSFTEESEREIIQTYSADLDTYFAEMFTAFISGTKDLSEFDEYLESLKALHVDDVTAVYQAIYDRQNSGGN